MKCELCGDETHWTEKCSTCGLTVCRNCEKSSKWKTKVKRMVCCKKCWSSIPLRSKYKSA